MTTPRTVINSTKLQQHNCETLMLSAKSSAAFADSPQPVKFSDVMLIEFFITWHSTATTRTLVSKSINLCSISSPRSLNCQRCCTSVISLNDPTNSVKALKEDRVLRIRLQSAGSPHHVTYNNTTYMQYEKNTKYTHINTYEPGELLHWLCHYNSTINTVLRITISDIYLHNHTQTTS